jgi:Domain of Unknown Function (DUF748)
MRKRMFWVAASVILVVVASFSVGLLNEPFRRYAEQEMNQHLNGYTVSIGALHLRPMRGAIDFEQVIIRQAARPDPPIAIIPEWHAAIHWKALIHGRLVSDHLIARPTLSITLAHVRQELHDTEPFANRGWQDAVLAVMPFHINVFRVVEAEVRYVDSPQAKPLQLHQLNVMAENIRNVESPDETYPSSLHVDGHVFESGRLRVDGAADFLAKPHLGVIADLVLQHIKLDDLYPVTGRVNVQLRQGVLAATGHVEYSPTLKRARIAELLIEDMRVDYVHARQTARSEAQMAAATAQAAKDMTNHPEWNIGVDHAKILHSELGFTNQATTPPYRVFLSDASLELENISNQRLEGTAYVKIAGKLMGRGLAQANATFRPEIPSPDFTVQLRVLKTPLRSFNALLRAYGDFDVTEGTLAVFSELSVKQGQLRGYVKPFVKDVTVYDPTQDQDKDMLQKLYEGVVGDAATALANVPTKEVATKTDVSGTLDHPRANTWEIAMKLLQNAFFKAILPGLEHQTHRG